MQVMSFFNTLSVLFFFVDFASSALAQDQEVILWQFGRPRLFGGQVTLPLEPLGTAPGGSQTTYLYQVVNPAKLVTVIDGSLTTTTFASTASRTIIASASGWFEPFDDAIIRCSLINSVFGECFDGTATVPANSGKPTPKSLAVALATGALQTPASTSTSSTSNSTQTKQAPSVGAIVGGILGGSVVLGVGFALCIILGRRRRRLAKEVEEATAAHGYVPPSFDTFAAASQVELGQGHRRLKSEGSETPTSDLVQMLAQRGQSNESAGQEAPPAYPGRPPNTPLPRRKN